MDTTVNEIWLFGTSKKMMITNRIAIDAKSQNTWLNLVQPWAEIDARSTMAGRNPASVLQDEQQHAPEFPRAAMPR
jgi:hypothetical protein